MLLYSTILDINDSMTKDTFIQLIIEWNQENPYPENRIPDLHWDGQMNVRYGNERLWLEIEEYQNKNIVAVRYEKKASDGAVWDTDYVMNFEEMKMSISLDRSYTEDALMENLQFSTPYFLNSLIDGGYVRNDAELPVLREPMKVGSGNLYVLTNILNKSKRYRLPVIYVSKTDQNDDPLDCLKLAKKLKGIAHVLSEESSDLDEQIQKVYDPFNICHGKISIYFPNGTCRQFLYRSYEGSGEELLDSVSKTVFQFSNARNMKPLYTWSGVMNALLTDSLERNKKETIKTQNEMQQYVEEFDADNEELKKQVADLMRANMSLQQENKSLLRKINGVNHRPIICYGDEDDFYPGEIRELVLDALKEQVEKLSVEKVRKRRVDVFKDILSANQFEGTAEERHKAVKGLFKGYQTMSSTLKQKIMDLGFKIQGDGKHYKLTYYGDERYAFSIAKTGSDYREGKNIAQELIKRTM